MLINGVLYLFPKRWRPSHYLRLCVSHHQGQHGSTQVRHILWLIVLFPLKMKADYFKVRLKIWPTLNILLERTEASACQIVYLFVAGLRRVISCIFYSSLKHNHQIKLVDCQPLDQQPGNKVVRTAISKVSRCFIENWKYWK